MKNILKNIYYRIYPKRKLLSAPFPSDPKIIHLQFEEIQVGKRYYIDFQDGDMGTFMGYGVVTKLNPSGYESGTIEVELENDIAKYGYFGAEDFIRLAEKSPNLLAKIKIYLIGAIESKEDQGAAWRNEIKEKLKEVNISWFDPLHKTFVKDVDESGVAQISFKELRSNGQFDELAAKMKEIRSYDLSMVDRSDAVIFYYDVNSPTAGSWEEFFHANSLKRVIFFVCKQGVKSVPLWVFGTIPHKYFYNNIDEVVKTIKSIDNGTKKLDSQRWRLLRRDMR